MDKKTVNKILYFYGMIVVFISFWFAWRQFGVIEKSAFVDWFVIVVLSVIVLDVSYYIKKTKELK